MLNAIMSSNETIRHSQSSILSIIRKLNNDVERFAKDGSLPCKVYKGDFKFDPQTSLKGKCDITISYLNIDQQEKFVKDRWITKNFFMTNRNFKNVDIDNLDSIITLDRYYQNVKLRSLPEGWKHDLLFQSNTSYSYKQHRNKHNIATLVVKTNFALQVHGPDATDFGKTIRTSITIRKTVEANTNA